MNLKVEPNSIDSRSVAPLPLIPDLAQPGALELENDPVPPTADPGEESAESEWYDALESPEVDSIPTLPGPAEEISELEWHDALENLEVSSFPFGDAPIPPPQIHDLFEGWSEWLLEWFEDMVSH